MTKAVVFKPQVANLILNVFKNKHFTVAIFSQ